MQRAYGYLSNSVTKLIYDQYGIPGLIMFDSEKKQFENLINQLRELEAMPELYQDTKYMTKLKEVEYAILRKGQLLLEH